MIKYAESLEGEEGSTTFVVACGRILYKCEDGTLTYEKPVLAKDGPVKDAPQPFQTDFQDPATPCMEGVIDLHHEIMFYLIIVVVFVFWMILRIVDLFEHEDWEVGRQPDINATHHVGLEWA